VNMICDICGQELVEVDNPFRYEVRHRRGVQCPPEPDVTIEEVAE